MNFERGQEIKKTLKIGIPTYEIYRMLEFQANKEDGVGFYITSFEKTEHFLKMAANKECNRLKYIIEFSRRYDEFPEMECPLSEIPTCFILYHGKKYLIEK